jgi:hypothetical protein
MHLRVGRHATSSLQLGPTSWLGSRGLYSRAATSTGRLQLLSQLETRCTSLRTADEFEGNHVHSPKVCTGTAGTNEQSNGVPLICVRQWSSTTDRLIRTDTRGSHHGQENRSPLTGRIHLSRLHSSPSALSLAVVRRTIHLGQVASRSSLKTGLWVTPNLTPQPAIYRKCDFSGSWSDTFGSTLEHLLKKEGEPGQHSILARSCCSNKGHLHLRRPTCHSHISLATRRRTIHSD